MFDRLRVFIPYCKRTPRLDVLVPLGQALPEHIKQHLKNPQNPLSLLAQSLGLTLVQRDIIPNTRRAHECTEYARPYGKLDAFHQGLIERYWSSGQDLHDSAVRLEDNFGLC
jgi:predicted DsbA family dithiol-disulfide isomerase